MQDKYQIEIDEFRERFSDFQDQRIILYGIGRYTATILNGISDYHFVGLMDKDPDNIGKTVFDLPILDAKEAEKKGDLIVINTSETYWNVIFNRIKDIRIPVYYKNGERAEEKQEQRRENPYRHLSKEELYQRIDIADVITVDFFETLFMRRVCNPRDVFKLLEIEFEAEWQQDLSYTEVRNQAIHDIRENYTFDELYDRIIELTGLPKTFAERIKKRELELEEELLVLRQTVAESIAYAISKGKEVFIISDMYLPKEFYLRLIRKEKLSIEEDHILISCELDRDKKSGSIWEWFRQKIGKHSVLHIGDNEKADVEIPREYGIETYQTPASWSLARQSSIEGVTSRITDLYTSLIMGAVFSELFGDPFSLKDENGVTVIANEETMGYCVFGPVVLTFLLWLLRKGEHDGIGRFVFMSRDGYLLQKDFLELCEALGIERDTCYIGISRQLAMTASIETRDDLLDFLHMPYSGSVSELFEDRLGISGVDAETEEGAIEKYVGSYEGEIWENINRIRAEYISYLNGFELGETSAVVDLGFYGNNQRFLNKLTGKAMPGYYFNANLSEKNENTRHQKMSACFQGMDDPTGQNSQVLKRMIFIESFLTAPYGMVKEVKKDGTFLTAPVKENQKHFDVKERINDGVKRFIRDVAEKIERYRVKLDIPFVDAFYGLCFDGSIKYSDTIKGSFYNDNAMMNRLESMLFY